MSIYKPYTYLIGWSELNKYYYGVRYAKGCNPDDLWRKYFTSSSYVSQLREEVGEPDIIQIRKIFDNAKDACDWEQNVLKRLKVWENNKWINKGYHKLYHKNDGSTSIIISKNTKSAMNNKDLRNHLSQKAKERGIPKVCCLICRKEMDNANFRRHADAHDGIKVFYVNNGIEQKRVTKESQIPEGWRKGRLPLPKEMGEKISKANKGKKQPKISKKLKGRKFTEDHKNKLSKLASKRRLISNGEKRKWLYDEDLIPEGWFYVKPQ